MGFGALVLVSSFRVNGASTATGLIGHSTDDALRPTSDNLLWTNPLRGSHDFGRGSDFAGWVGDKHPRLPLAGQLNRETMTWRHVALFVSQRSCQ